MFVWSADFGVYGSIVRERVGLCLSCQELGPYHVGTEAGGSLGKRNLHLNSSMASNGVTRADVSAIYSISGLVAGPDCCRGACSQDIGGSKGPSTHQILTPLYLSTERCSFKVGPTRPVEAKLNTVRCRFATVVASQAVGLSGKVALRYWRPYTVPTSKYVGISRTSAGELTRG